MTSQPPYLEFPHTFDFDTAVLEKRILPSGHIGVVLETSYFYPTSGGQEHDIGTLGTARVVDVYKDKTDGQVIHVVDGEIAVGPVQAHIDPAHRLTASQGHTAQHLLTHCFLRLFDLETLSVNINAEAPSTLDLPQANLTRADLDRIENLANSVVFENRPVRTYIVAPQDLAKYPLRRQPTVSENIRIVEIDGLDFIPCGGTHCHSTGEIGSIKLLKTERPKDGRVRVIFVAGRLALEVFQHHQAVLASLTGLLGASVDELPRMIERQIDELRQAEKELQAYQALRLAQEANLLYDDGQPIGCSRMIFAAFDTRPLPELRQLADELRRRPGVVALLSSYDGNKATLLLACGPGSGVSAKRALPRLMETIHGRGGGDDTLAQGGGVVSPEEYASVKTQLAGLLRRFI